MLTVVVLGASAGGLDALRAFFRGVTPTPTVAIVVVTHLPPSHDSQLVALLDRVGTVSVRPAVDGHSIEGGTAYVLPPGTLMGVKDGRFVLAPAPPVASRPPPKPIDFFMRALAEDAPECCVGVVLSGTDHDGTAGLKAIKEAGGLSLVQSPDTAEFPGMPHSAIEARAADQVLPPEDMPAAIREYLGHAPGEGTAHDAADEAPVSPGDALVDVLKILHARTGHDFQWYRPAMLRRRLRRRMGLNRLDQIGEYVALLDRSQQEVEALKNEFLIGVTDFFRDPDAWRELEAVLPAALTQQRVRDGEPVRVWTPGCATGEESYSIAMLLLELFPSYGDMQRVQVFATDIDLDALAVARAGSYPAASMANVSPARLARFFERRGDRYVARKALRDSILFAPHNLVRDTPYSKLDLVLCRNVLIYFQSALQQQVFELFHFALKPGGFLLLGKAESTGTQQTLFESASRTVRLYRRVGGRAHLPPGIPRKDPLGSFPNRLKANEHVVSLEDLVKRALAGRAADAAVLVDADGRALHFHGDAQPFLRLQGAASFDMLTLIRPGLRVRVRRALREALSDQHANDQSVLMEIGGAMRRVRVEVEPVAAAERHRMALVRFSLSTDGSDAVAPATDAPAESVHDADHEYEEAKRELSIALEEAERSNEDLRVANEESLSLNEELQSSNEELESAKEELQSVNEELATVNAQLEDKIQEVAATNDDLTNLLASSRVATVLLDAELRVRRFTPSATDIFNLKQGDEGRLLSDISSRVVDRTFERDLARIEHAGEPIDAEVESQRGAIYLRRLLPHRGTDGRVTGAVATYVDVTALRTASRRLSELVAVLQDSNDAVIIHDFGGRILEWNAGATRAYGRRRDDVVGTLLFDLVPATAHGDLARQIASARETGHAGPEDSQRLLADGSVSIVSVTLSALRDPQGREYALLSTERDITARLQAEKEMYFRRLADLIPALLRVEDGNGRTEFVNQACVTYTGCERAALLGDGWFDAVNADDRPAYRAAVDAAVAKQTKYAMDLRCRRVDGVYRWVRCIGVPRLDDAGKFAGYVELSIDVHDRKRAEDALLDADRRKDEYLAMLAHELRNPLAPIRNAVAVLDAQGGQGRETRWATGVITRQAEALAKLLDDLLDVARIARGKVTLERHPVDISVVVDRAIEVTKPAIEARQQHLELQMAAESVVVEGDLLRLTQVLTNLLNNASKYSDAGGHLRIDVESDSERVRIRVSDGGAGISAEMLPRVFDLFAQADRTLDRAQGGLGLGLTLVRRLVELHGGTVAATSEGLRRGSQFVVELPLLSGAAAVSVPSHAPLAQRTAHTRRVLIVDDNADAAESLAVLLAHRNHEVHTAFDGSAALSAASSYLPEVVILDVGLPDTDGYQVARTLRGRRGSARATLIALTGYGQPDDVARALAAGFDHHLVKPADPSQLIALVEAPLRTGAPEH